MRVGAIRRYAAEVGGVDDGVGRVMETLKKHGLDERTLVIFTADQGWCGGHHGIWGMGDHTRPLGAFDEMMHIPLIWRQSKVIAAGKKSDLLVSNYDFLPTMLDYLGLKDKTPIKPVLSDRSYAGACVPRRSNGATRCSLDANADIRKQLLRRLDEFFDRHADLKYDLKRSGKSKTPLHMNEKKK